MLFLDGNNKYHYVL